MIRRLAVALLCIEMAVAQTDLGTRLSSSQLPRRNTILYAATPSQVYPCLKDMKLNGIGFSVIGYDAKTHRVKYLLTYDKHFVTRDGLRVGGRVEIAEDCIVVIPGWEIFGPTSADGWRSILGSAIKGRTISTADGNVVDLSNPISGQTTFSRLSDSKRVEYRPQGNPVRLPRFADSCAPE